MTLPDCLRCCRLLPAVRSADIPMLVAGDFNSIPGSPAHCLLVKGKIDPHLMVRMWRAPGVAAIALGKRRPHTHNVAMAAMQQQAEQPLLPSQMRPPTAWAAGGAQAIGL